MKALLSVLVSLVVLCAMPASSQSSAPPDLPSAPSPTAPALPPGLLRPNSQMEAQGLDDHTQPLDCSAVASPGAYQYYYSYQYQYRVPTALTTTQQKDLQGYISSAFKGVREHWLKSMPFFAQGGVLDKKGTVGIRFTILANGAIDTTADKPIMTVPSGHASFDKHAMKSLLAASPFKPLPAFVPGKMEMCVFFLYNEQLKRQKPLDPLFPAPAPQPSAAQQH